jgi:hypothetical protein
VSSGELRSTAELATWIAMAHKTVTRRVVKVLVLGNSGAGKSFLVNVVLGANTFAHRGQLASVTDATTYAGLCCDNAAYVFCNSPGLIEAGERNRERNSIAIRAAFSALPGSPTVMLFVADGSNGGRLGQEDLDTMATIPEFARTSGAEAALIINRVGDLDVDPSAYVAEQRRLVAARFGVAIDVVLVNRIPASQKQDYDSAEMVAVRETLLRTFRGLAPTVLSSAATQIKTLRDQVDEARVLQEQAEARQRAEREAAEAERRRVEQLVNARREEMLYLQSGDVRIVCVHSGKVWDVCGAGSRPGTHIMQFGHHGQHNQRWRLLCVDEAKRIFEIVSPFCGQVVDVRTGGGGHGLNLIVWPAHHGGNQRFTFVKTSDDVHAREYFIQACHSGLNIDVNGGSHSDCACLIQWPHHGGGNQRFRVERF